MTSPSDNSRSYDTRERLLRAGVQVFSELGFEAASTRQLASQAGVNLAAIPYHFESKKGLYLAVAEHVAGQIGRRMLPAADESGGANSAVADAGAAREALRRILHNMAEVIIGEPEADCWAGFILREQAQPTEAFDVLYERTIGPMFDAIARLVARLTDASPTDEETRIRSLTLVGQLMIFRTSRAGVLRSVGWDEYTPARIEAVMNIIDRQIDLIVAGAADDD